MAGFDLARAAATPNLKDVDNDAYEKFQSSIAGMTLTKLGFQPMARVGGESAGAGSAAAAAVAAAAAAGGGATLRAVTCEALTVPPGRTLASTQSGVMVRNAQQEEKKARKAGCRDSVNCESVMELGIDLEQLAAVLTHHQGQF